MTRIRLVVMGASWGGLHALGEIFARLPRDFGCAVTVAQHRSASSPGDGLARVLQRRCPLPVREAEDKDPIEPGHVYIAPPDYHLIVEQEHFGLSLEEPVRFSRPSIDVLFESAARSYDGAIAGVILTGANADGAAGLAAVKRAGGITVVQDPATAASSTMPEAAIASGVADKVLPLEDIAPFLVELCTTT